LKIVDDDSDVSGWLFTVRDEAGNIIGTYHSGESEYFNTEITYTVSESGPGTYHFSSIGGICSPSVAAADVAEMDVDEQGGVCSFSNNINKGSVTVIKDSIPDDEQDFSFTVNGIPGVEGFYLDDDGDKTNEKSNTWSYSELFPGSYTISEVNIPSVAGWYLWYLSSLDCQTDIPGKQMPSYFGTSASFNLEAGENVTCTFTNEKRIKIIVDKVTNPSGSSELFDFVISGTDIYGSIVDEFSLADQDWNVYS